jgi:ABC-type uncharacterized transport system auxiliary subunit
MARLIRWLPSGSSTVLLTVLIALLLAVCACSLVEIRSESPAVARFRVDYAPPTLREIAPVAVTVRVRDLGCARDYTSDGMVLSEEDLGLTVASTHRWSQPPDLLLPDMIARDLLESGLVSGVDRNTPGCTDYLLNGYIREFGGSELGGEWFAVIEAVVIFEKTYDGAAGETRSWRSYEVATPLSEEGFEALAEAMNSSVEELSRAVITDLVLWIHSDPGAPPSF